jgi:host factor-I protein
MTDIKNSGNEIQDAFLKDAKSNNITVLLYLVNGVKLSGKIINFDHFSLLFTVKDSKSFQLVYKHAISTILPE